MDIRQLLYDAFAGRRRPDPDRLVRSKGDPEAAETLRRALALRTVDEVSAADVRVLFEGNLGLLTPETFLYFVPALMYYALTSYESLSVFASELVGALTNPVREDIEAALDRFARNAMAMGTADSDFLDLLRAQQLEWFDSGAPAAEFQDRVSRMDKDEGAAVLAFLTAFSERYREDFPFGELTAAIDRYWYRFART
jgi:hypothetical protein